MKRIFFRRPSPFLSCLATGIFTVLVSATAQATPTELTWTGTIVQVVEDDGPTFFTGTMPGDSFAGKFVYENQPANEMCGSSDCTWSWSGGIYGGQISPGTVVDPGNVLSDPKSYVFIGDNQNTVGDPDSLALINAVLDPDILATTPFDLWELAVDQDAGPDGVVFFALEYFSLDTSLFTDTSFSPYPPDINQVDGVAFVIEQTTADGSFVAIGTVDTVDTRVDVNPVWLFNLLFDE